MTLNDAGNSRSVTSNQSDIHEKLEEVVQKHLASEYQKPFAEHSQKAFEQVEQVLAGIQAPLILDSCCGVGESTANLAKIYPQHFIVGVDKSAHRIGKHDLSYQKGNENYLLVRADMKDFWRLAVQHNWQKRLEKHFILYPNPWPKSVHLKRRWHGEAVFPTIIKLGGELLVRSNWQIYIREFYHALIIAGEKPVMQQYSAEQPITPFERKYWASDQSSWQVVCRL